MRTFKYDQSTSATHENIWDIWLDVPNWHEWDTELESATLEGEMQLGAKGVLKPKGSPESKFTITEYTEGKSFTFSVQLPLAQLDVAHYFTSDNPTTFVHEVTFKGLMGWLFARILGGQYNKVLPDVLINIQDIAEQKIIIKSDY